MNILKRLMTQLNNNFLGRVMKSNIEKGRRPLEQGEGEPELKVKAQNDMKDQLDNEFKKKTEKEDEE